MYEYKESPFWDVTPRSPVEFRRRLEESAASVFWIEE
jgi:hypothetical protein